jgi:hypothetical protein
MPSEVDIYLDADGLKFLLSQLKFLSDGRTDHVHLMSESWGGGELDERPQSVDAIVVHHVKIVFRS